MARALLNAKLTALLAKVAEDSAKPPGYSFRTMVEMQPIIDAGNKPEPKTPFVTWNAGIAAPGDASKIAFVPTDAGKSYIVEFNTAKAAKDAAKPAVDPNAPKPAFEIETVEEIPDLKTRGRRESLYPFAELTAPVVDAGGKKAFASFFVPAPAGTTGEEMFKKFGSTVSSATKRYNKEGSTDKRKFTHRAAEKNGQPGVRVFRVE